MLINLAIYTPPRTIGNYGIAGIRFSAVSLPARALPPARPPGQPIATAAAAGIELGKGDPRPIVGQLVSQGQFMEDRATPWLSGD